MQDARRIVRTYLRIELLYGLGMALHGATYVSFLMSRGLNLFEVNLVNMAFFTTLLVTEVPTGVLADKYGRKVCVVGSAFLLTISLGMYGFAHSFLSCVLAEVAAGVGATLINGAFNAWLYSEMGEEENRKALARKAVMQRQQFNFFTMVVAAPIGGVLGSINLAYPWFASAFVMGIAAVMAFFTVQQTQWQPCTRKASDTVRIGFKAGLSHPVLRFLLILMTLQLFCVQAPNMQWQPYFQEKLGSIWVLGVLKAGIGITLLGGSLLAPYILKRVASERRALLGCQTVIGTLLILSAVLPSTGLVVTMFLLHEVARGAFGPLSEVYLNDHVRDDSERATVLSTVKMGNHFGGMVGLFCSGFLALQTSIATTWVVVGMLLILGSLLLKKNGGE